MLIRSIKDGEIGDFVDIQLNSYPREKLGKDEFEKIKTSYSKLRENTAGFTDFIGFYEDDVMKGCMILYKYDMMLRNSLIKAGGIGSVAVHMLYRKQKICKGLIEYAHDYFSRNGMYLSMLYPFRTDFYMKMGYGFGPKKELFAIRPDSLPRKGDCEKVRFLGESNAEAVLGCYEEFFKNNGGLCRKHLKEFEQRLSNPSIKAVGFEKEGKLSGYCLFKYVSASRNNFIKNNIEIIQLVYNDSDSLYGILKFFGNLSDQINRIIWGTQDDMLYHLFSDPRDGSDDLIPSVYHKAGSIGVGIMYRITDLKGFISSLGDNSFGKGEFKLKISLEDSFREKNNGDFILAFSNGKAEFYSGDDYDGVLCADMASLSSLLTGSIDLKSAYRLSKVNIDSAEILGRLTGILNTEKPICLEDF